MPPLFFDDVRYGHRSRRVSPAESDRLLTEMALHDALYRDRRGANEWGAILLKR
ncbi:MAG: hypothetical protein JWM91_703 [Rhodospirillales bacterium]|nr:hypothetical protein [Rhodospirillales bacterium]